PADPMPPAQLLSLGPCFVLLQNPNDLLFRETALAHRRSPRDRLNYQLEGIPGSRSVDTKIHELYKRVEAGVVTVVTDAVKELDEFIGKPTDQERQPTNEQPQRDAGGYTKTDESPGSSTPE